VRTYELGDNATGVIADQNDWNRTGPRIVTPRKTAWGTVIGVFAARTAVMIQAKDNQTYCIRVDIR
jgi:hypothetical protein